MNQKEYTSYRQKLLGLMDDALAIEDIPIEAHEELQETQRTLLEDSFEIVLSLIFPALVGSMRSSWRSPSITPAIFPRFTGAASSPSPRASTKQDRFWA